MNVTDDIQTDGRQHIANAKNDWTFWEIQFH